jgi:hypothetical protein
MSLLKGRYNHTGELSYLYLIKGRNHDPKHYFCNTRCPGFNLCGTEHASSRGKISGVDHFYVEGFDDIWNPDHWNHRRVVITFSKTPERDQT